MISENNILTFAASIKAKTDTFELDQTSLNENHKLRPQYIFYISNKISSKVSNVFNVSTFILIIKLVTSFA